MCARVYDTCVEVRKQLAGVSSSFYSVGLGMELRSSGLVALLPTEPPYQPWRGVSTTHSPHGTSVSAFFLSVPCLPSLLSRAGACSKISCKYPELTFPAVLLLPGPKVLCLPCLTSFPSQNNPIMQIKHLRLQRGKQLAHSQKLGSGTVRF